MSRNKIIEAAARMFSRSGYHRTSMDEIALEAGVAKGTLYYHFPGKAQMFQALITEGLHMITETIRSEIDRDRSLEEQIETVIRLNVDLYLEYSELAHIFFNEISNGIEEDALLAVRKERSAYIQFIADILVAAGMPPKDGPMAAAGILSMMNGLCSYYLSHPSEASREQIDRLLYAAVATVLRQP
ncbi:TetR/AcrR family transcriptional regulator [Paenibacillus glycanilyticus]|uniref:TetR/AcrR family transcriptional regulator n=1 Tax=Paenibacillus glycanilyticus TaxID=126569 RepID=UPI00203F5D21|nr:TetR/AcrR family transcriptional regulator [Paenibacillus glycanilyticus]MCM3629617.1 TetR/AcrR family transcriptional regulator [Paenibacillus glycanilyticus]